MSDHQHRYVYGITEAGPLELEVPVIGPAEAVSTLEHRRVAAVYSPVETPEVERTDEALKLHDDVLRAILEEGRTVVPMTFGMVFTDEETLRNVIDGAYPSLRQALDELSNTVELGLKVVAGPDGTPNRDGLQEAAAETVDPVSVAMVENDLFSDRLLLNRSYLVKQDDRDAFGEAVAQFEERASPATTVQYTGPWAPYNFVDIEIAAKR